MKTPDTAAGNTTILIVEDNDDDYEACLFALTEDNNLGNPIHRCETGDKALDYLFGRGEFENAKPPNPGMILLDLNLPGTDGREILGRIKTSENLKAIPIIVMTTSSDEKDINECYRLGANSYVVKPVDMSGFFDAVTRMRDYWFQVVVLPEIK